MNSSTTTSPSGATDAGSTTAKLAQTARDAASQVRESVSSTASRVADSASQYASDQKAAAADRVKSYGDAIHESAKSLEQRDPNIAWFTHQAADRLERAASYVRDRDFRTIKTDAENFARRHPAVFFGGLCVAGLILGSVLKASARATDESYNADGSDAASNSDSTEELPEFQPADAPSAPAAQT